ncbi:MAG: hypothetical protein ACK5AM_14190, partial [Pirellulaceae bacterium]
GHGRTTICRSSFDSPDCSEFETARIIMPSIAIKAQSVCHASVFACGINPLNASMHRWLAGSLSGGF